MSSNPIPTTYHQVELVKPVQVLLGDDLVDLDVGTVIYLDADWGIHEFDGFLIQARLDFSPEAIESVVYVRLSEVNFLPILPIASYQTFCTDDQEPEEPQKPEADES